MREIHLIFNPASGKGNSLSALNKIKEWTNTLKDLQLTIHTTENIGHATVIARDLTSSNKPVTILALGGDGTLSEVLNGINNFETTTLGILPFGSGNDFFRVFNIEKPDPIELMSTYVNNPVIKKVDFLLLNDKYRAINEIGLGMSAEVIAYRNKMKHFSPITQYKIATLIKALFWKKFTYNMSVDKSAFSQTKAMWFTINNGFAIGGGMITAKDAKIDDGLISISFVKPFCHMKTIPLLAKCKKGKVGELKQTVQFTCKEIELEADNVSLEFDGNLLENQTRINVKIVSNKLNLLNPRK